MIYRLLIVKVDIYIVYLDGSKSKISTVTCAIDCYAGQYNGDIEISNKQSGLANVSRAQKF